METALLLSAVIMGWFWIDTVKARETAVAAGRRAAEAAGLQFLDETVSVTRLWAARDDYGRLRLQRTYAFEVSDTGADRLGCSLVMLGKRITAVEIPPHRDTNIVRLH